MKRIGTSALILALLSAGCVNPSITRYQDSAVTSRAAREKPSPAPQPPLRKEPVEMYREADSGKRYSLVLKDAELQDVLTLLSRESNLTIVAEKGIDGRVTVNLNNRKLGEVLYAVLKPLGYSASVENGVILIGQPVLVTRSFPINYVKDTRSSTSTTSASVFSGGGNSSNSSSGTTTVVSSGSSGSSGGGGGGSVSITTTGTADFWPALESALEVLIFGNTGEGKRTGSGFIRGDVEKFNVTESESSSGGRKNKSDSNQANDNANARKDGETDSSSSGEKRATSSRSGSADTSSTHTKNDKSAHGRSQENNSSSQANQSISYERKEMKARRQLIVNEMAGMVQVTDYADNIDKVAAFLSDIELAVKRQVLIQAHIIEVTLNDGFSLGLDWQQVFRSAGSTFTIGQALSPVPNSNVFKLGWEGLNSAGNFSVILDAMKDQGQVKMLSSPKISAMNNQKAVIKLTTKQVSWYTKTTTTGTASSVTTTDNVPQIDEVGIFLDVTPQVSREGTVTMQVHPSVSEVKQLSTSPDGKSNKPVIEVREIDTMVDAKSGETVIIAGLIADKLRESKQSVPFLVIFPTQALSFRAVCRSGQKPSWSSC
ncbi:MAG: secretin N-terminal domain-containing protein [Desulfuromonadales bacterium]